MTENKLLAPCLKLLRAELAEEYDGIHREAKPVILKHADGYTSGTPDVSISWRKRTTWWEFKHGPRIIWANALQQLTCRRLAVTSTCHVVLYEESSDARRTCILTPDEVLVASVDGFSHRFVMDFIRTTYAS